MTGAGKQQLSQGFLKNENGQRLSKLMRSASGFLRIGVTDAVISDEETIPVLRDEWIILVMRGTCNERQALTNNVGTGSR